MLKQNDAKGAGQELDKVRKLVPKPNAILANLAIDVKQASGDAGGAIDLAKAARAQFPQSRMLAQNYADSLQQAGRHDEAIPFLREQLQLYLSEAVL